MDSTESSAEIRSRSDLERLQVTRLKALLFEVLPRNQFWRTRFTAAGLAANAVNSLGDLQGLPTITKAEILADQAAHPPYGTNLTYPLAAYSRLHQTSGTTGTPLRWLDTPASWDWI